MPNIPDCFCDQASMESCDWAVEAEIKYYRPNDPDATVSIAPWSLKNIPQLLAQAIFQSSVDAVNQRGAEVYIEWLKACTSENDPMVQFTEKVLKT